MIKLSKSHSPQFTRREAMQLFSAGIGLGVVTDLGRVDQLSADSLPRAVAGAQTLQLPRSAIIRSILKDIDPNAVSGVTLMHEHLGTGRRPPARGGEPDAPPDNPRPLLLFVPRMRKAGVREDTIRRITVDNPRRFLAFVPKQV